MKANKKNSLHDNPGRLVASLILYLTETRALMYVRQIIDTKTDEQYPDMLIGKPQEILFRVPREAARGLMMLPSIVQVGEAWVAYYGLNATVTDQAIEWDLFSVYHHHNTMRHNN